jgi:hypothetical protein
MSFSKLRALLALALLWIGLNRIELSSGPKAAIWIIDFFLLAASIVSLGWVGVGIVLFANALGILGWSVRLAMQKESLLVYAAIQAATSKERMQALHRELQKSDKAFRALGPIELARLIKCLSERGRGPDEIEHMARPIALLQVVHKPRLEELVEKFDRLLRLCSEPAENALAVADRLTKATQVSAATFQEMLDASVATATSSWAIDSADE